MEDQTSGAIPDDARRWIVPGEVVVVILINLGLASWFFALLPLHVKLFSISFILFGWLFRSTILEIRPTKESSCQCFRAGLAHAAPSASASIRVAAVNFVRLRRFAHLLKQEKQVVS